LSSGLLARALAALQESPRSTAWLAREILGLQGHEGVAARAIFTLLGSDPRLHVAPDGVWSLKIGEEGAAFGPLLRDLSFAVVDVETTGGRYDWGHRVTDLAIVPVERGVVGKPFSTLIHPGRDIPPRIQSLTGISPEMVAGAPRFDEVAEAVGEALRGRVFTAHNVRFDWSFVSGQLTDAVGEVPEEPRLCTVRMGRALVPGLSSYGLDGITRHFQIEIEGRHRALGDALATARVLVHLLDAADREGVADLEGLERLLRARGDRRNARPRPRSGLRRSPDPDSSDPD
jgi:DNA polymerase III subunit epsilon